MESSDAASSASPVEVTEVSPRGIWLLVRSIRQFLPYDEFPWFREARLRDIFEVELLHGFHLYWPTLDIDLERASLENPDDFPLVDYAT